MEDEVRKLEMNMTRPSSLSCFSCSMGQESITNEARHLLLTFIVFNVINYVGFTVVKGKKRRPGAVREKLKFENGRKSGFKHHGRMNNRSTTPNHHKCTE